MNATHMGAGLGLVLLAANAPAAPVSLSNVSASGTLEAGGVVAVVSGDSERNARALLEWRAAGETAYRAAHDLARIDATRFAGSLFGLQPARTYDVRVTLVDPDGVTGPITASASFSTRTDATNEPSLRTLHVAPTGNDTNPGTSPGAPLRTIQRAADLAQAGDRVLIQPGVYRERVTVARSGTAAQPIVFRGSGPGVILDGADAAIAAGAAWSDQGNGVFSLVTGFATGHVVAGSDRLYRYGSRADLQASAAGAPGGFFFDGTTLFVKLTDGTSPAARTMHVARLEEGFVVDGRAHVRLEDVEIRHYGSGDFGKGVYLRHATDCVVRRTRIHHVGAAGIWLKGGARHLIEDNEVWDSRIFGWPWSVVKGSAAENNALVMTDDPGRGTVIRRNVARGTFNGIGPCGSAPPPNGDPTSETDVYDNVLSEHLDDAVEPEGFCANVRIWGNRIRDVHMAFAVAPAAPGPTYIVRNIVYRHGNTRASRTDGQLSSALKINSGYPTPIGPLFLYHNTIWTDAPETDAVALFAGGNTTFIRARNNLLAATRYALYKVHPVVLDWDADDLFTTDAARFVRWNTSSYTTLAQLRAGTGQEMTGLAAPPRLEDPAAGDFRPALDSPLVDAGQRLPGVNDGFAGAAPDIGAVERREGSTPNVWIRGAWVIESDGRPIRALFRVVLSSPGTQAVTVAYQTQDGTARAGEDYVARAGSLTFAPGQVQRSFTVEIRGERTPEPAESFAASLTGAAGATIIDGRAECLIVDDDRAP